MQTAVSKRGCKNRILFEATQSICPKKLNLALRIVVVLCLSAFWGNVGRLYFRDVFHLAFVADE